MTRNMHSHAPGRPEQAAACPAAPWLHRAIHHDSRSMKEEQCVISGLPLLAILYNPNASRLFVAWLCELQQQGETAVDIQSRQPKSLLALNPTRQVQPHPTPQRKLTMLDSSRAIHKPDQYTKVEPSELDTTPCLALTPPSYPIIPSYPLPAHL